MRPYATVSPLFWTGKTGKRLRKESDAQRVAFYLMTSPHAHQSGIYCLPLMYLCNEVGIADEGARKALSLLDQEGFSKYDFESEWVWVCEMAAWQIGTELSENDKRCKGVQQYLLTLPTLPFVANFVARYASDFHLRNPVISPDRRLTPSPTEAPSKEEKGASSEQNRTEQEQIRPKNARSADDGSRGTRIEIPFPVSAGMLAWAKANTPNVDVKAATAEFEDYWKGVPGLKGRKTDWEATWRNRMREVASRKPTRQSAKDPYANAI